MEKKTVTEGNITITYQERSPGKMNINRMMHIEYVENGEIVEYDAYPAMPEASNQKLVDWQFSYVKALMRFDKVEAKAFIAMLKEFLKERPQLSPSAISLEAGFSSRYLSFILDGEKSVTRNVVDKLRPVMLRYGFGRK